MVLEKSSVRNAKELVNYLITEVIRHVQCVVELQMRLVPHALAQVELPLPLAPVVHSLNVRENWDIIPTFYCTQKKLLINRLLREIITR
jgi:hypothetical protein